MNGPQNPGGPSKHAPGTGASKYAAEELARLVERQLEGASAVAPAKQRRN